MGRRVDLINNEWLWMKHGRRAASNQQAISTNGVGEGEGEGDRGAQAGDVRNRVVQMEKLK